MTNSENSTKSGRFKEVLGTYDPRKTSEVIKADRVKYWVGKGVQLTPTVQNLLVKQGVLAIKKVAVAKSKPVAKEGAE